MTTSISTISGVSKAKSFRNHLNLTIPSLPYNEKKIILLLLFLIHKALNLSKMLPQTRLLCRAIHRVSPTTIRTSRSQFSTTTLLKKWEGRQAEKNPSRETDTHNAQQDAVRAGKADRASGDGSSATSEKAGGDGSKDLNRKAEKDHPEAPGPVIGMNDERGGVSI